MTRLQKIRERIALADLAMTKEDALYLLAIAEAALRVDMEAGTQNEDGCYALSELAALDPYLDALRVTLWNEPRPSGA